MRKQEYILNEEKTSGKKLNEMEVSNLLDKEFKVMVIKMFTTGRMQYKL